MKETIIYLLAIIAAEVITVFVQPVWGIVCHAIALVAVVVHSALASDYRYRNLILSLTLVPLVRIISLSIPLVNISQIWWYLITYAPLLAATIVVVRILGFRTKEIGLSFSSFPVQLAVTLSGLLFGGWGIIYVSLLFTVMHIGFLTLIDVIFVFCVTMFFGWVVKRTGSFLGVPLAHGITNILLYLVAPFF